MTATHDHGHHLPIPDSYSELPHPYIARLALEVLSYQFNRTTPDKLEPEEEDIQQKLHAMHAMLWDKEMNAVADSGLTAHYLIIRPINPLNMPSPQETAEISTALATLHHHGLIARGWSDG